MIEVAAILSAVVQHWADFWIIVALLVFNAGVGFWQEFTAGNAVEALKKQLALRARALRDGTWQEIDAKLLVPGDVIRIRLGDVVPADVTLIEGDYLSVDQSALTGESLPVTKQSGDEAFSGTVVKQGEVMAEVSATGGQTKFGKTASLVEQAKTVSHFQKAVLTIGDYLIYVSLALVNPGAVSITSQRAVAGSGAALAGTANAYVYTGSVAADRPASDYTPRIIPMRPRASIPLEADLILWYR